jgi:Protein of unknown function (DUF2924)
MEAHTTNGRRTTGPGKPKPNLPAQLAALARMPVAQLRAEYARLFGEATPGHNRVWLVRRIAWRLQALAEGDLSERARRRAAELAHDADLRSTPPAAAQPLTNGATTRAKRCRADDGQPAPGTILTRIYKGAVLEVHVLAQGFAYQGTVYRSLSAVAKAVTHSHCSGRAFFRLARTGAGP